jgi:hypothetical protein
MNDIQNHIKSLEEKLLHSDFQKNPEIINELLSEEFEEVGVIGKISSREEVIFWLLKKDKDMKWALNDFKIRVLTPDLVLATYQATSRGGISSISSKGSIRSSIWQQFSGHWKIIFHQGTKIL